MDLFEDLARAYLAEADAQDDKRAADGLRTHARFAEKFISLTNHEISNLEQEADRAGIQARLAEARSRGDTKPKQLPAAPRGRGSRSGSSTPSRKR